MAFDGITTKAVISELQQILLGGKINKVFQPTKNEIILSIYNKTNYNLLLSANPDYCRLHLTEHPKPNPQHAPNFCMLLRKYLVGGKIIEISNYDLERTVQLKLECYNELNDLVVRKLFIQIMSRQSNILLTNEKNIIIDSLKHFDNALPAHPFTFAKIAKQSFLELNSAKDFVSLVQEQDLISCLSNLFIGFSKNFIQSILQDLEIDTNHYTTKDLENLYSYLHEICSAFGTNHLSLKWKDDDYSITLTHTNQSINQLLDKFYFEKEQKSTFLASRNNLLRIVSRLFKKNPQKARKHQRKTARMRSYGYLQNLWRAFDS